MSAIKMRIPHHTSGRTKILFYQLSKCQIGLQILRSTIPNSSRLLFDRARLLAMFDGGEFCSSTNSAECFSSSSFSSGMCSQSKKKGNNKNMRRFSDEQIKSLESMFETETKLDPRKKLQLARELGLQPRQVAIWFQNKRARWKSKQLERDYSILKANYNNLASQYECLKKEKQSLVMQLQKLNDLMMEKPHKEASPVEDTKPTLSFDLSEHGGVGVISDEDSSIKAHYFGLDQDPDLLKMVEAADSTSLTSPENWGSLDDDGLLDQHSTPNQWWDFWS